MAARWLDFSDKDRMSIGALLAAVGCALSACACPYRPLAEDPAYHAPEITPYPRANAEPAAAHIAVIGDVQRTSELECCWLHREINDNEQRILLRDLAEQKPDAIVLLGDLAFKATATNWQHFDRIMNPLRKTREQTETRFFPVMGNHDYSGYVWDVWRQVGQRFPDFLGHTHYAFDWGKVRMIVLDGNREQLCVPAPRHGSRCEPEWQTQLDWLRGELVHVDEARGGGGALVFVHQSPYTQSPWVQGDQSDARDFAQALLASKRGLALISAHAHGYERYRFVRDSADQRAPKYFIISAGGGGPRPATRDPHAPRDESVLPWPRPFNYLMLDQDQSGVHVHLHALAKGAPVVQELKQENVSLKFRP